MRKNYFFQAALVPVVLIFISGCGSSSSPVESWGYEITPVGMGGSCVLAELQDENGDVVSVPEDLEGALSCLSEGVALSRNRNLIVYEVYENDTAELNLYSISGDSSEVLYEFPHTLEGAKCIWRDDSQVIACAVVNQEVYDGLTEVVVVTLDQYGEVQDVKNVPQTSGQSVDFTCGALCYPGAMWFEEDALKYAGHQVIAPGETFTVSY